MEPLPASLEHDGLVLRRWTVADAEQLAAEVTANLEHLRPFMPWIEHEPLSLAERRELVRGWDRAWAEGGDVIFGIFEDGVFVGGTGLHRRLGPGALEIGYWVHVDHLGKGIARRVSEGLTSLAFTVPGIDRVEIHHDLTNVHSRRIPEQLGFHLIGKSRTPRTPQAPADTGVDLVWRITRNEWLASHPT
ncbi:GNAT family N-acetyltransferase [Aquihabitans daechungensis]|uniref:GNAT family N-acetyltransferase n=1 Tax=Aquihabitans daechungensis TaxID=1052257 RepID=UPI003B9F2400